MSVTIPIMKLFAIALTVNSIRCINLCTNASYLHSSVIGEKLEGEGILIETLQRTSLMVCSRECFYQTNCLSFNFNTQTGQCELNRNLSSISKPLITSPGFLYAEKSDWMDLIRDPCRYVSCLQNEKCFIQGEGRNCAIHDCGVPPEMTYSNNPKYTGTVTTYEAIYSCFGTSIVREDLTLTCKNGSWEGEKCRKISSCSEIKQCDTNYTDGEYWIYPFKFGNTHRVKIYCHGLNTTTPTEYITLPFKNVVSNPSIEVGVDVNKEICNAWQSPRPFSGGAIFNKIRIVPDMMKIVADDVTFTTDLEGYQSFGKVWDCTSRFTFCDHHPRSYGKIDMRDTGLIISRTSTWITKGWQPIIRYINRTNDQIIELQCSGLCGGCEPNESLTLDLDTTTVLADDTAVEALCV